ncbi:hypothetical protein Anas_09170 [Armadillidium nasatum]|uniref:Uncharacterized protein n=1 Tax=Armadillidium nasatum TaxID=96803 RepID=A0A5N5TG90_9CRUS|nr:hypothetical protein Anas_09170 [Armadillidium nasatum]
MCIGFSSPEQQYLVQMVQVPPKSRRYGVVDGRFVWEGGTRSLRGCGVHVAISDTPNEISRSLDLASRGALNSKHRRGSIPQPSAGTIQRDAAMWLRDVGAIDICQFSEIGDTLSIVASEAGSILSPRTEFVAERRPDCDIVGNSYTTAGSSSSSGSIVGDEPGWWANTWASGRGSLWEVAPSPIPESLYDSPRPFPHSLTSLGVSNTSQSQICLHGNHKNHPHITHKVSIPCHQKPYFTSNPMDNYDVPKPHFQHYDVPRKFNSQNEKLSTHVTVVPSNTKCFQQSTETDSCGKMLCWPSSLMCRRNDFSTESEQLLRVNGEGKMPVLDANTGTLVKPTSVILCQGKLGKNDPHKCTNTSVHYNCLQSNLKLDKQDNTKENVTVSNDTPIYAVIDKSKKSKPRAPTPPPSPQPPDEETPTNSNPNYANVFYNCKSSSDCEEISDQCHKCGGIVCKDSDKEEYSYSSSGVLQNEISKIIDKEEAHYLMMGPGPTSIGQSHYLCMKSPGSPCDSKLNDLKPSAFKPGRSLSLARTYQGSNSSLRRSTSADSILQEPFYSSHFDTPDPTPCGTPLHSPPHSPFRTSTPRSESSRGVRGRPRKRTRGQCQIKSTPSPVNNNTSSDAGTNVSLDSMPTSSVLSSPFVSSSQLDSPSLSKSKKGDQCTQPPIIGPINPLTDAYTVPNELSSGETPILRRSSSVPGKSANRDSASSSDSGVCESPRPTERVLLSHCPHSSLPRGPKQKPCQAANLSQQKSVNNYAKGTYQNYYIIKVMVYTILYVN